LASEEAIIRRPQFGFPRSFAVGDHRGGQESGPRFEGFVGVIVQRESPKERLDANWAVKGVKFGKADRDKSSKALATIVERMQREFVLAPHVPRSDRPGD
jgi:hypothetical protein